MLENYPYVVKNVRNGHSKPRYYFRRKGFPRTRLPGAPGSPEFIDAYNACLKLEKPSAAPATKRYKDGSIGALVAEYEASTDFTELAILTQREARYVLKDLERGFGDQPVIAITRRHVALWRDKMQAKPGAANKMLRVLKVLMSFAVDRSYRKDNPVSRIKMMKLGSFRAWKESELLAFADCWSLGSLERLGFALALYTGQRRADLVKLTFTSIEGNAISLTQSKTGKRLTIPIHPELRKALPAIYPNDDTPILAKRRGRCLSPVYFGHLMARAIEAAGLQSDCVLHGLRKSAAVALIEAGCTPHQAAAVTGHASIRMLEEYARDRDQAKLGRDAMEKWEKVKR